MAGQSVSTFDKINYIVKTLSDPCDEPWLLYAELAIPAFGEAILMILGFGLDDVVRGWARPKGFKTRKQRRRLLTKIEKAGKFGRIIRFIPGLGFDIGNTIGRLLPFAAAARTRKVSQGIRNLWIIDGVLQRVLWWWLIADVTIDFFYAWTSLMEKAGRCETQGMSTLFWQGGGTPLPLGDAWAVTVGGTTIKCRGAFSPGCDRTSLPAGKWSVVTTATIRNNSASFDGDGQIGIRIGPAGTDPEFTSATQEIGPGQTAEFALQADITGPVAIAPTARLIGPLGTVTQFDNWYFGTPFIGP